MMKDVLNSLSEGERVILNEKFEVEFLDSKVEKRMDPHAEKEKYNRWWLQDDQNRMYEVDDMLGKVVFDRDGVGGSFQAKDAIARREVVSIDRKI